MFTYKLLSIQPGKKKYDNEKNNHLKMYLLLKHDDFPASHVSFFFLGGVIYIYIYIKKIYIYIYTMYKRLGYSHFSDPSPCRTS